MLVLRAKPVPPLPGQPPPPESRQPLLPEGAGPGGDCRRRDPAPRRGRRVSSHRRRGGGAVGAPACRPRREGDVHARRRGGDRGERGPQVARPVEVYSVRVDLNDGRTFAVTTGAVAALRELRAFATTADLRPGTVRIVRRREGTWTNGASGFTLEGVRRRLRALGEGRRRAHDDRVLDRGRSPRGQGNRRQRPDSVRPDAAQHQGQRHRRTGVRADDARRGREAVRGRRCRFR
ncbi:MAG: hypothetical protein MZV64_44285 [Ignavibacteriales bacterium]|nr:hypothetical protein [Ignavibacteriales bacterium]